MFDWPDKWYTCCTKKWEYISFSNTFPEHIFLYRILVIDILLLCITAYCCKYFLYLAERSKHFALGRALMPMCLIQPSALYRLCLMETVCVVYVWWNVNQRELAFQSVVWLYWKSRQALLQSFGLHALWSLLKVEATSTLLLGSQKH